LSRRLVAVFSSHLFVSLRDPSWIIFFGFLASDFGFSEQGFGFFVNGSVLVLQFSARISIQNGGGFGEDGQGNLIGGFGAEVQADGGVEAIEDILSDLDFGGAEEAVGAVTGAEDADVFDGGIDQQAEQFHIFGITVRHDHGGIGGMRQDAERIFGGDGPDALGAGETIYRGHGGAAIADGNQPADLGGETDEGEGIVAGA
jgi:hypothetical protein